MFEIILFLSLALAFVGLFVTIVGGFRNQKVYEFSIYINSLVFLNNILLINIGSPDKFDVGAILPSYDRMVWIIFIPIHKFFKKPDGFKMYSDFTEEDKRILVNAKYVTDGFREHIVVKLGEVAFYERRH